MRSLAILLSAIAVSAAPAATFSFTGNFAGDDDVQLFSFTLDSPSSVTFATSSYAAGGFDTILTLFDASGIQIVVNDDGAPPDIGADPTTLAAYDAFFTEPLAAGSYILALTQFNNFAPGGNLLNGFAQSGNPAFTAGWGCSNGSFCDDTGANRSSVWAVDIRGAANASPGATLAPEPSSIVLLSMGLALASGRLRRRPSGR